MVSCGKLPWWNGTQVHYLAASPGGHRTERPRDQNKMLKTHRKKPGRRDGDGLEVYNLKSGFIHMLSPLLSLSVSLSLPHQPSWYMMWLQWPQFSSYKEAKGWSHLGSLKHICSMRQDQGQACLPTAEEPIRVMNTCEFYLHFLGRDVAQKWEVPMINQFGDNIAVILVAAWYVLTPIPFYP